MKQTKMKSQKQNSKKKSYRELTGQFYRKNKINFILSILTMSLVSSVSLLISWLIQQIMDCMTNTDMRTLARCGVIAIGILGLYTVSNLIYRVVYPRFLRRAMQQYKDYAFDRLTQKGLRSFAGEGTSLYISALTNDCTSIEEKYLKASFSLVQLGISGIGALIMMLWYSPVMLAVVVLLSLLPVVASMAAGNRLEEQEKEISKKNEQFVAIVNELLSGFSVVKSFRAEKQAEMLFGKRNDQAEAAKESKRRLEELISILANDAGIFAQMGIFLFGAWLAVTGRGVTPGVVIVFVQLMNFILSPISQLPLLWSNRKAALGLIEKLADALNENVREEGMEMVSGLSDAIEIRDLTYGYEPQKPVLNHLNARLEAGKSYAVVGGSGSGKSTLLNLLMGSSGAYDGEICVDGVSAKKIKSESLYQLMTTVQQSVFVFNDTIRNNVTMFHDFPDEEVAQALQKSGLAEFIAQRGEAFVCGENGANLSGGERQRISIARALLRKTPVLLADEATASLDAETAKAVSLSILDLQDMTRVVVTHRLEESILSRYDRILVMKAGTICEEGNFHELMEKKGQFYSLFQIAH